MISDDLPTFAQDPTRPARCGLAWAEGAGSAPSDVRERFRVLRPPGLVASDQRRRLILACLLVLALAAAGLVVARTQPDTGRSRPAAAASAASAASPATASLGASAAPAAPLGRGSDLMVGAQQLQAAAAAVASGAQPQTEAWQQVSAAAQAALSAPLETVCDDQHGCAFWSQKPYSSDGVYARSRDRGDYETAGRVSSRLVDLGVAYQVTHDRRYATRAAQQLRAWMVDPATRMDPVAWNAVVPVTSRASQAIDIFITVPGMLYGAALVWDSGALTASDQQAVQTWADRIATDALNRRRYSNNIDAWRLVLVSSGAALAGDSDLLARARAQAIADVTAQIDPDGSLPQEEARTRSLHYTSFALQAFTQVALVTQLSGRPLLADGTARLRYLAALHRTLPYLAGKDAWSAWSADTGRKEIGPIKAGDDVAFLEVLPAVITCDAPGQAGQALERQVLDQALTAVRAWGRPLTSIRNLGPVTLTHAGASSTCG